MNIKNTVNQESPHGDCIKSCPPSNAKTILACRIADLNNIHRESSQFAMELESLHKSLPETLPQLANAALYRLLQCTPNPR